MMDYAAHFKSAKHRPILIYDGIRRKQRYIIVPNMREQRSFITWSLRC